jgi:hypothetical protein
MELYPIIRDSGFWPILGFDRRTCFLCLVCKKTRFLMRQADHDNSTHLEPIVFVPATTNDAYVNDNHPLDVCYFCLREAATWHTMQLPNGIKSGPSPCGNCIGFGYFDPTYTIFIKCDGQCQDAPYNVVSQEEAEPLIVTFKTVVLRAMNKNVLNDRYNLLMALRRPEFVGFPKVLRRYICEVGLPLPCPW